MFSLGGGHHKTDPLFHGKLCTENYICVLWKCFIQLISNLFNYSNLQNSWQKRRGGETAQGKAKDAGGLTPAKDGNAVLRDCCPLLPTNFCREF